MESRTSALDPRDEGKRRRSRALIVGGGATGQVYGYHLAQADAEVTYYLKPKYAAEAEEGFVLHPFGLVGRRPQRNFGGFEVVTSPRELRSRTFDQVWLCISGPALQSGVVGDLAAVLPDTTWVCLQPGLTSRAHMLEHVTEEQLVMGMIGLVAYQAPLPGEDLWPEGVAYWSPPMSPTLFSGSRAELIANTLQAGGLGAAVKRDVEVPANFGSGALIPFVVALESARWSFGSLRRSEVAVERLVGSIGEIFTAVGRSFDAKPGALAMLQKPFVWKAALLAAPSLVPFPLETYLEHHFSKLRKQSEEVIAQFRGLCERVDVDAPNLAALEETWLENRPPLLAAKPSQPKLVAASADQLAAESNDELVGLVADSELTPVPRSEDTSQEVASKPQASLLLGSGEPGSLEQETDGVEISEEVAAVSEPSVAEVESSAAKDCEGLSLDEAAQEGEAVFAAQIAAELSDVELDLVAPEVEAASELENVAPSPPASTLKPALNLDKLRAKLQKSARARAKEAEELAVLEGASELAASSDSSDETRSE